MPETAEEIIAKSRAKRARIAANQAHRSGEDAGSSLVRRANAAVRSLESTAARESRMASVRAARPRYIADAGRESADDVRARAGSERNRAFASYLRRGTMQAALTTSNDPGGGFLVPMDFERMLVENLVQVSQIRQAARVGTTSLDTVRVPKRTSASTAQWLNEVDAASESDPAYGAVDILINGARYYVDISNDTLMDAAVDIEAYLTKEIAREFARLEGAAFISGTGNDRPTGFLTSAAVNYVAGGDASNLIADAIINLPFSLPAHYAQRGAWFMNRNTMSAVRKLKDTVNRYLFDDNLNKDGLPTIQGLPVYDCPDMPSVASNAYPIVFGAMDEAYYIYDRLQVTILRDPYTVAGSNKTRFWAFRRLGGAVVLGEAIVKLKISTS